MKKALDAIGSYKMEHRGLVEVKVSNLKKNHNKLIGYLFSISKGKGLMDTFWLTCKEGGVSTKYDMETENAQDEDVEPIFMRRLKEKT